MSSQSPIQLDNNDDVKTAAAKYVAAGLRLVKVSTGSKKPTSNAWQNAKPTPEKFGFDSNIGVMVGEKSGHLIDLDFDIPQARSLSSLSCFFGALPSFRRSSYSPATPGHRLLRCPDAPNEVVMFDFRGLKETAAVAGLNLDKSVVLEIRAGKGQTVLPPSVIGDDKLVWDVDRFELPEMPWVEVRRRAGLLAFSAFAAACYPAEGNRDNFCFLLAGVLVRAGVETEIAEEIIEALAELKSDDVKEREGKAIAAADRLSQGEPVPGLPKFLEFIGMEACEKRLREWLQMEQSDLVSPPIVHPKGAINASNTNIGERTKQIEQAFLESDVEIFRFDKALFRVLRLENEQTVDGVTRYENSISLAPATPGWLAYRASEVMTFLKETKSGMVETAPTAAMMRSLEDVIEDRRFPELNGLMATPTLTCNEPGYDPNSRLYLSFEPGEFGDIPLAPTIDDAREALQKLLHPVRDFPFDSNVSRSVWLSAMLTAVVRGEFQTAPLFAFDAPTRGTGKTKLAEMVGILALGTKPPAAPWGERNEENDKKLFSILRQGDPAVLFDNVDVTIESANLCAALTSTEISDRILGVSEMAKVGTRTVFMFTGNNIEIAADLTRRSVRCRLNAQMEHPEDRTFDFDPVQFVRDNRKELVAAALTVLRAYHAAGRPAKIDRFNSFEDWDLVRGALVWLGEADPKDSVQALRSADPTREEKAQLIVLLSSRYDSGERFLARDLREDELVRKGGAVQPQINFEITRMTGRNDFNAKAVGALLRRHRDQPFMGLTLKHARNSVGETEWFLEGTPEPDLLQAIRAKVEKAKVPF